eukprot:6127923-Pleurochrysis_carterae.AAC.1
MPRRRGKGKKNLASKPSGRNAKKAIKIIDDDNSDDDNDDDDDDCGVSENTATSMATLSSRGSSALRLAGSD